MKTIVVNVSNQLTEDLPAALGKVFPPWMINNCEIWDLKKLDNNCYASYEHYLSTLEPLCRELHQDLLVFTGGAVAAEMAVRLACKLQMPCRLHVESVKKKPGEPLAVLSSAYGSNMKGKYLIKSFPAVLGVDEGTQLSKQNSGEVTGSDNCDMHLFTIRYVEVDNRRQPDWLIEYSEYMSEAMDALSTAKMVIAGGRGMGNKASFEKLEHLAEMLDAAVGATRPAALNGWLDLSRMIGISGTSVTPKTAVVFGASGAAPFMSGLHPEESLVAVNSDENAPVFHYADVGFVEDAKGLLDELLALITKQKDTGR